LCIKKQHKLIRAVGLSQSSREAEMDKILEEIQKSEKRFKLAMIIVLFIVSLAAAMIFISLISSL
jgi:hypothetical protein